MSRSIRNGDGTLKPKKKYNRSSFKNDAQAIIETELSQIDVVKKDSDYDKNK